MARADLILALVKASRQSDDAQVRKAIEALAADERANQHNILADRLLTPTGVHEWAAHRGHTAPARIYAPFNSRYGTVTGLGLPFS